MPAESQLDEVDLTDFQFAPECDMDCNEPAAAVGQGCGDGAPVLLCERHLRRNLEVIRNYVRLWQKVNKRVMICEHCYRPMFSLETHLEIRRLQP